MASVAEWTDPAQDVVELCKFLKSKSDMTGRSHDTFAFLFGAEKWSRDFFVVLSVIHRRLDELQLVIESLKLDDDLLADATTEIASIRAAFNPERFAETFFYDVISKTDPAKLRTIRLLVPQVRAVRCYPLISEAQRAEICADIRDLIEWLDEHQLSENDFIRAALIEGLKDSLFRFEAMHFFGWAHTAASLRAVVSAYMALERMNISAADNPDAEAVVKKVRVLCLAFFERMRMAKEVGEIADFSLRLYGAANLALIPFSAIAGYLR